VGSHLLLYKLPKLVIRLCVSCYSFQVVSLYQEIGEQESYSDPCFQKELELVDPSAKKPSVRPPSKRVATMSNVYLAIELDISDKIESNAAQ
jgi:hypothetical protein